MNAVAQNYIRDVKRFFPIMGKEERSFLKKLREDIEIFCEEENVSHKKEIYKSFGSPYKVVSDFYESEDIDVVIKKIRVSMHIRVAVFVAAFAVLAAALSVSLYAYIRAQAELTERIAYVEEIIMDGDGNYDESNAIQGLYGYDATDADGNEIKITGTISQSSSDNSNQPENEDDEIVEEEEIIE